MKQEEITQMTVEDIEDRITSTTEQYEQMAFGHKVSPLENPLQLRSLRRTIARLKTELSKRNNQN